MLLFSLLLDVPGQAGPDTMLTHSQIASVKPAEKPHDLYDGNGLFVAIQPNGSKLWRFRYRYLDRQKTLHLGQWPSVSLADARAA